MPAKPLKLNSAATAMLVPLLVHTLVGAAKPLVHLGIAQVEGLVTGALDQARPWFLEATTADDRAAIGRIVGHLFNEPAADGQ